MGYQKMDGLPVYHGKYHSNGWHRGTPINWKPPSLPIPCVFSIPKIPPHRVVWLASGSPPPDAPRTVSTAKKRYGGMSTAKWKMTINETNLVAINHDSSVKNQSSTKCIIFFASCNALFFLMAVLTHFVSLILCEDLLRKQGTNQNLLNFESFFSVSWCFDFLRVISGVCVFALDWLPQESKAWIDLCTSTCQEKISRKIIKKCKCLWNPKNCGTCCVHCRVRWATKNTWGYPLCNPIVPVGCSRTIGWLKNWSSINQISHGAAMAKLKNEVPGREMVQAQLMTWNHL